jgi:hypothetical protein
MTRTTVTLDPDVEQMLRDAMHERRLSFKQALNEAVRRGLADGVREASVAPYRVKARALGLRPGIDAGHLNQQADELEAEAFQALGARLRGAGPQAE